mgnify:CR=1 FL=1
MKRDGHIIEEIVEQRNLEESFDTVLRGNVRKRLREGKWLLANRAAFLESVKHRILDGSYRVGNWHAKSICEGGKHRNIQVFNMRDRIAVNAIMSVVDKHIHRRLIRTTSASIKNRGMHDLKHYIERDIRSDHFGTRYAYKFDIRKFYDSVNHDLMMSVVRHYFKDARLVQYLDEFVRLLGDNSVEQSERKGISIVLRSSQGLGNLFMSHYFDHRIKSERGVRYYYRYCDDGLALFATKQEAWAFRDFVHECARAAHLTVKSNERVFPISEGIDFLGYVIYPDHSRLRKRIKQTFARKIFKVRSRKRRTEIIGSFYGLVKHADCKHLLRKLLTRKEMRKFSELGVTYTPADGKKRFIGQMVRLGSIINNEIEIHDYERDVKTQHGDNRYLVSFREKRTGEMGKFFTASDDWKQYLDKIAEIEDGFPFETIIRSERYDGNKFKYIFT